MKKQLQILFSVLLLVSISWQCAAKSYIFIQFKFNQKELTATVCENKDKPKSCCEAKCQLDKEIKKEEKRQSELPSRIKDKVEKSELSSDFTSFKFLSGIILQEINSVYVNTLPNNFPNDLFHPPGFNS